MLGSQIDNFLQMMAAEKGAAPNSVAAYDSDLHQFIEFGPFIEADSLTKENVENFLQDLHSLLDAYIHHLQENNILD